MKEEKVFENINVNETGKIEAVLNGVEAESVSGDVDCEQIDAEADDIDLNKSGETEQSADTEQNGVENTVNERKYGKFKNPDELLKAYGELEKEFTRRSQRLKELEGGKQSAKQTLKSEEEWKGAVDKFFTEIPTAKPFAKEIANEIIRHPELKENANCLETALVRVLADKFRTPEQMMEDGQFLNDYVLRSERVRDAIIADYMEGVREGRPPYTMHSGGMQCVAPKVKPKTIEEAGFMFLKNNK